MTMEFGTNLGNLRECAHWRDSWWKPRVEWHQENSKLGA